MKCKVQSWEVSVGQEVDPPFSDKTSVHLKDNLKPAGGGAVKKQYEFQRGNQRKREGEAR